MDSEASPPPGLPSSLEAALIPTLPPSAYYIPNFITPSEEAHLLRKVFPRNFPPRITFTNIWGDK